jgi:hypothetical protein
MGERAGARIVGGQTPARRRSPPDGATGTRCLADDARKPRRASTELRWARHGVLLLLSRQAGMPAREDVEAASLALVSLEREIGDRRDEPIATSLSHTIRRAPVADVKRGGLPRRGAPKQQYPTNSPASVTAQLISREDRRIIEIVLVRRGSRWAQIRHTRCSLRRVSAPDDRSSHRRARPISGSQSVSGSRTCHRTRPW